MTRILAVASAAAILAAASALARSRSRDDSHHRILRHLLRAEVAPRWTTPRIAFVARAAALLGLEQSASEILLALTALSAAVATVLLTLAIILDPGPADLLVALLAGLTTAGMGLLVLRQTERSLIVALKGELVLVLTELDGSLHTGMPLPQALEAIAAERDSPWRAPLSRVVAEIQGGVATAEALLHLAALLSDPELREPILLLAHAQRHHATPQVLPGLLGAARRRQHAHLISSAARIEQLVWIPVAIATLVPGLMLVMVPLASSLGSLLRT